MDLAYPRRCGEHPSLIAQTATKVWLTPAGAGNTVQTPRAGAQEKAYPRRCGEHRHTRRHIAKRSGLPPQVRGTL